MKKLKKYTKPVITMFEPEMHKEMEKYCKKMHVSVSEFIRFSVQRSLKHLK